MAAPTRAATPGPVLPSGSRVLVIVSRGQSPASEHPATVVPELLGHAQDDALKRLQQATLNAQVFNDYSDHVKRGHVVDQFPPAGASASAESEVVVMVSNGPAEKTSPTPLPDVVGLHETEAIQRLSGAGLDPQVVRHFHPNADEGVVIAQLPSQTAAASGKSSRSLAWIWVLLAVLAVLILGGAALAGYYLFAGQQVSVPSVTGMSQKEAEQTLSAAGLRLGVVASRVGSTAAAGTVLEQNPPAGVEIDRDAAVNLVVAGAIPQALVPNVVGSNASDAKAAVSSAGFVAQVTTRYNDTVPRDVVISQSPASGTSAARGSAVKLDISLGAKVNSVTLPNFIGLTQAAATNKAVSLGLRTRVTREYDAEEAAGVVVAQIPDAGLTVAPGTTIGLSVSLGPAPAGSVTVPAVTSQSLSNAQSALTAVGLLPATVSWDGTGQPVDAVVGQLPKAGEQVPSGSGVVIFVSSGK